MSRKMLAFHPHTIPNEVAELVCAFSSHFYGGNVSRVSGRKDNLTHPRASVAPGQLQTHSGTSFP